MWLQSVALWLQSARVSVSVRYGFWSGLLIYVVLYPYLLSFTKLSQQGIKGKPCYFLRQLQTMCIPAGLEHFYVTRSNNLKKKWYVYYSSYFIHSIKEIAVYQDSVNIGRPSIRTYKCIISYVIQQIPWHLSINCMEYVTPVRLSFPYVCLDVYNSMVNDLPVHRDMNQHCRSQLYTSLLNQWDVIWLWAADALDGSVLLQIMVCLYEERFACWWFWTSYSVRIMQDVQERGNPNLTG